MSGARAGGLALLRQRLAYRRTARPLLGYFGHHKCGTQWVKAMMDDASRRLRIRHVTLQDVWKGEELYAHVAKERIEFLSLTNADPATVQGFANCRGFHVIRDPRDLVVSAYFSHRNSHPTGPWLEQHRDRLRALDAEQGLLEELKFSSFTIGQLRDWNYAMPNVLELRLEEFARAPEATLLRIAQFLDLPLFAFELRAIAARHSFARKSGGRAKGVEDPQHHYRKGQAGDWVNHFRDGHKQYFKEHYQDVLEKLGYERDDRW